MNIRITGGYIVAFLFLTMLCGLSHEMIHHLTGAVICGCWGYKTFNSFFLCDSCAGESYTLIATIAGPIFTFGLIWWGVIKLRSSDLREKQMGFALIFANFPINRILFVFLNMNDEQWVSQNLFGSTSLVYWITVVIVLIIAIPPLIIAFKKIMNKYRIWWFLGFFILPFVFVIIFAGFLLEEFLLLDLKFLAKPVFGIPYLLIIVEILCMVGFAFTKKYIYMAGQKTNEIKL